MGSARRGPRPGSSQSDNVPSRGVPEAVDLDVGPGDGSPLQIHDAALDRRAVLHEPDRQLARLFQACGRPRIQQPGPNPGAVATIKGGMPSRKARELNVRSETARCIENDHPVRWSPPERA